MARSIVHSRVKNGKTLYVRGGGCRKNINNKKQTWLLPFEPWTVSNCTVLEVSLDKLHFYSYYSACEFFIEKLLCWSFDLTKFLKFW